jgi:hypothetical protein
LQIGERTRKLVQSFHLAAGIHTPGRDMVHNLLTGW